MVDQIFIVLFKCVGYFVISVIHKLFTQNAFYIHYDLVIVDPLPRGFIGIPAHWSTPNFAGLRPIITTPGKFAVFKYFFDRLTLFYVWLCDHIPVCFRYLYFLRGLLGINLTWLNLDFLMSQAYHSICTGLYGIYPNAWKLVKGLPFLLLLRRLTSPPCSIGFDALS